jgi:co-chaperonin GroES (HSP10)
MKKEQSSILTPNNKLVGVKPSKTEEPKLPKPTGWRLLVLPFKMEEKTKGGIVLAETTLERQQVASQVGLVMAMGPQCYKDKLIVQRTSCMSFNIGRSNYARRRKKDSTHRYIRS